MIPLQQMKECSFSDLNALSAFLSGQDRRDYEVPIRHVSLWEDSVFRADGFEGPMAATAGYLSSQGTVPALLCSITQGDFVAFGFEEGACGSSTSFRKNDLPKLEVVCRRAYEFLNRTQVQEDREGQAVGEKG